MPPNDPLFAEQWALTHLRAPAGWNCVSPGAPDVILASVDTGIDGNHEDLQQALLFQDSVLPGILRDDDDHGTMVAGVAGAVTNNGVGIAGAAKVRLLSVKFCSQQVWPDPHFGALAIRRAADYAPSNPSKRVIVLPWDVGYNTPELQAAIEYAGSKDAVVAAAAGNHSLDNDSYPNWPANHGRMAHVITVMASDDDDERSSFSNFGKKSVHLSAPVAKSWADIANPGIHVLTTSPYFGQPPAQGSIRIGYRPFGGTSASAAYVGALAALVRAKNPRWAAAAVKRHILATARRVPSLTRFCVTGGVADYQAALCA
jgi:thermitase